LLPLFMYLLPSTCAWHARIYTAEAKKNPGPGCSVLFFLQSKIKSRQNPKADP
jgi:hypothetical protein